MLGIILRVNYIIYHRPMCKADELRRGKCKYLVPLFSSCDPPVGVASELLTGRIAASKAVYMVYKYNEKTKILHILYSYA